MSSLQSLESIVSQVLKGLKMYVPKQLLVTGGPGFIGSNFVNHLLNNNKTIQIISLDK